MPLENKLKKIGFTNFIHLNIDKRDNLRRLTWTGYYKKENITVLIVENNEHWSIEKIFFNDKDLILNGFPEDDNIEELINYIENS